MKDDELDEAIELATRRTLVAQEDVSNVIEADDLPPVSLVDRVVERAEDLDALAHEAAGG